MGALRRGARQRHRHDRRHGGQHCPAALGKSLHADFAALQWTVNGYLLMLASFILLGGSFGDRFGRRQVFVIGVTWFGVASLLCGVAQTSRSSSLRARCKASAGRCYPRQPRPYLGVVPQGRPRTGHRRLVRARRHRVRGSDRCSAACSSRLVAPGLPDQPAVVRSGRGGLPAPRARVDGHRDGPADRLRRRRGRRGRARRASPTRSSTLDGTASPLRG